MNFCVRLKIALKDFTQIWTWAFILVCVFCNAGCMTSQLRNPMTEQAASIPDVYYQAVLDNLAM